MIFKRDNLEYEFLPPALEIEETPPSPTGRITIWIIFAIIVAAVIWSYLGVIDEVAVARGKIIPEGKIKVIQPLELSQITQIHVSEGQRVTEGQLLIELDSTTKKIDMETVQNSLETAKLEKEIFKSELQGKGIDEILSASSLPVDVLSFEKQGKESREAEFMAKEEAAELRVLQISDQLSIAKIELLNMEKKNSKLTEEETNLKKLYEDAGTTKEEWDDKKDELFTSQNSYKTQLLKIEQAETSLKEAEANLKAIGSERENQLLDLIIDREKKISEVEAELKKEKERIKYQKLCSPVEGVVNGLTTNTVGGVVTPAQPIMTIVPDDATLVAEATVLNSDIGFIKLGQETEIKLDTFPFQRYGTIKGKVVFISPDAFEDEKLGPVYKIKVQMEKTKVFVIDKYVGITSGMTATVEVKTRKRRIIEYFLDPFMKHIKESFRQR